MKGRPPALLILNGPTGRREIPLTDAPFVIGRSLDNELELVDSLVSRRHTRVVLSGEVYRCVDLNSSNGTFVNGQRITEKILVSGDSIRIGTTVLTFQDPNEPSSVTAALEDSDEDMMSSDELKAISVKDLMPQYTVSFVDTDQERQRFREMIAQREKSSSRDREHFLFLFKLADLINRTESFDRLLRLVMPMVFEGLNAERGVLMMKNAAGQLVSQVVRNAPDGDSSEIHISSTITNLVLHERKAVLTGDATLDPKLQMGLSIVQFNIRSALCAPIWVDDDVYGLIYIDNLVTSHAFTEADRDLLTAVGNQIGAAYYREILKEQIQRDAIYRSNLERYHSPDVVDMILNKENPVGLEVEARTVTVLFSDIEGFSKLSERLSPKEIAELLNGYFEIMTRIVFEYKGSLNKFIGDAIMAIFGAPVRRPDDAERAVRASLKMIEELAKFRETLPEDRRFRIRIGINTGSVVAGNIGATNRLEYTVLGDAVNVAARLEKQASPNGIAIGEDTAHEVEGLFEMVDLGPKQLRGMGKELRVYEVLGVSQTANPEVS